MTAAHLATGSAGDWFIVRALFFPWFHVLRLHVAQHARANVFSMRCLMSGERALRWGSRTAWWRGKARKDPSNGSCATTSQPGRGGWWVGTSCSPPSSLSLFLPPNTPAPLCSSLCSSRGVGASLHSEAQTCQSADKVAPRPCPRAPAGTYGADTPASPLPHRDVPGRAGLRPRSAAPWWRVRFGGPAVVPRSFLKLRGGGTCSSRSPSLSAETQRRLNAAEQLRELCIPPVTLCRPLPPPVPGPRREILGEEFPLK